VRRRRLFVDCDDTLIIWEGAGDGPHPYGAGAEGYHVNEPLVRAIGALLQRNQDIDLFIWSGGGRGYAQTWANEVHFDPEPTALAKDTGLVRAGDIVVDDMLASEVVSYRLPHGIFGFAPAAFIEWVEEGGEHD